MTNNLGTTDRAIRFIAGLVLLAAPVIASYLGTALGTELALGVVIVGLVLVGTAFMRFCPLYRVLGVSTGQK
jgi:uncharacterized membrane protein